MYGQTDKTNLHKERDTKLEIKRDKDQRDTNYVIDRQRKIQGGIKSDTETYSIEDGFHCYIIIAAYKQDNVDEVH